MLLVRIIISLCIFIISPVKAEDIHPPFERSVSMTPKTHQDRFKAMLEEAGISYKTITYYDREFVVWEKGDSVKVKKIEYMYYTGSEFSKADLWHRLGDQKNTFITFKMQSRQMIVMPWCGWG